MKAKKILSTVLSSITALGILCGYCTAYAYTCKKNEHMYTLDELIAMDNEEFFRLKTDNTGKSCKDLYIQMKNDILSSDGSIICFYNSDINNSEKYQTNVTEQKIKKLFGSKAENFISPIYLLELNFTGYDGGIPADIKMSFDIEKNDEDIINLSKYFYCMEQVLDIDYIISSGIYPPARTLNLDFGDVNLDEKVDITDAVYINKGLTGEYDLTNGQKFIGDMNSDGRLDIIDSILIRKNFMPENEQAKAAEAIELFEKTGVPLPCDVSGNNETDLYDLIAIAESIIGKKEFTFAQKLIADYNADGKIDLYDAIETAILLT